MTEGNDLEKKFEEEMDRARALSLESLALEQFRLQKLEDAKHKGTEICLIHFDLLDKSLVF